MVVGTTASVWLEHGKWLRRARHLSRLLCSISQPDTMQFLALNADVFTKKLVFTSWVFYYMSLAHIRIMECWGTLLNLGDRRCHRLNFLVDLWPFWPKIAIFGHRHSQQTQIGPPNGIFGGKRGQNSPPSPGCEVQCSTLFNQCSTHLGCWKKMP